MSCSYICRSNSYRMFFRQLQPCGTAVYRGYFFYQSLPTCSAVLTVCECNCTLADPHSRRCLPPISCEKNRRTAEQQNKCEHNKNSKSCASFSVVCVCSAFLLFFSACSFFPFFLSILLQMGGRSEDLRRHGEGVGGPLGPRHGSSQASYSRCYHVRRHNHSVQQGEAVADGSPILGRHGEEGDTIRCGCCLLAVDLHRCPRTSPDQHKYALPKLLVLNAACAPKYVSVS